MYMLCTYFGEKAGIWETPEIKCFVKFDRYVIRDKENPVYITSEIYWKFQFAPILCCMRLI